MIVFLDIDGVLNNERDWGKMYSLNPYNINEFCSFFKNKGVEIVLTSSWRTGWEKAYSLCTPQIQQLISILKENGIHICGKTEVSSSKDRSTEIIRYIKKNNITDNYIVIDDDINEFKTPINNLYLTNSKNGFIKKELTRYVFNA